MLQVSIITACYNSEKTIEETIESVLIQDYSEIEYIIIDGRSQDKTLTIIESYGRSINKIISETDNNYYDAVNKGIGLASGNVIGILNSDDVFADSTVISRIVESFENNQVDIVWGDVVFLDNKSKVRRYYRGENISPSSFNYGIMPPHPSVFIRKYCYDNFGHYNVKYKFADYDLLLRFIKLKNLKFLYIPKVLVKMKLGGISNNNIYSIIGLNKEIYTIHLDNGTPISIINLLKKIPRRLFEVFDRPK